MNKVIDKGFRSCRFVSTIVKHPVYTRGAHSQFILVFCLFRFELLELFLKLNFLQSIMSGHSLYMPNEAHVDQYLDSMSNIEIQHEGYSSTETKEHQLRVELQDSQLWRTLDYFTNEMITGKQGR